jgi:PAB-dependent poly(A)-specific ribonuclease subunit 3
VVGGRQPSIITLIIHFPCHSYLLQPGTFKTWNDIMPWIGARFFERLDEQSRYLTVLESSLSKELYNGHLFRLMTKLSMVRR